MGRRRRLLLSSCTGRQKLEPFFTTKHSSVSFVISISRPLALTYRTSERIVPTGTPPSIATSQQSSKLMSGCLSLRHDTTLTPISETDNERSSNPDIWRKHCRYFSRCLLESERYRRSSTGISTSNIPWCSIASFTGLKGNHALMGFPISLRMQNAETLGRMARARPEYSALRFSPVILNDRNTLRKPSRITEDTLTFRVESDRTTRAFAPLCPLLQAVSNFQRSMPGVHQPFF
mmetsp:Transcript_15766/g.42388  ORF Transcript_15766/g.42388 Transcript_15766/m.42388 type:complete len:234 (-) Transcript_15766:201-902(-)